MSNSNFLWEIILRDLKAEGLSPEVFETWFLGASIDKVDFVNKNVIITSKEVLVSQYLKGAYDDKLKAILKKNTGFDFNIEYDSLDNNFPLPTKNQTKENSIPAEELIKQNFLQGDKPSGAQHFYQKQSFPLEDYKKPVPNKNISNSKKNPTLNKNYTFDNFVVGDGNRYAHAVAYAVADSPGGIYNPLFIYGGVGLGKTHLLHAIGNEMEANFPDFKIECISSEKFLNEFLASIKPKNNKNDSADEDFRRKYRDVDALLIDDIQFLSGKTETQNAFFHTFNDLQMNQKQIVLISDRAPSQLNDLEDRLVTRFEQGMKNDITPPDFETRMAILKYKCGQFNIELDEETLTYISNNVSSNIRELEGVLKRIKFISATNHEKPSLAIAEKILKDVRTSPRKNILPENIINVCSDFYRIKVDDMLSSNRKKEVVQARNIAIYLCRELTNLSFPAIGEHFNKDHTSILYSFNKIAKLSKDDFPDIFENIEIIKEKLGKI
ncbi:chromosomal replication initiator protein DnaA [Gemella cuniculi]|uniref:chromosomal replication initiator protein DnaA n=1 Tax=Gemella cuniculi TaxID=150240 RepID=UPI000418732E|nr:chromosomal replication initiator protein DnaA [Gemella cuniculi]